MITRRTATVLAGLLLATSAGGVAHAAGSDADVVPVHPTTSSDSWACVAVDHVEVGTCVDNPLPDLSGVPSVRQLLKDTTGLDL